MRGENEKNSVEALKMRIEAEDKPYARTRVEEAARREMCKGPRQRRLKPHAQRDNSQKWQLLKPSHRSVSAALFPSPQPNSNAVPLIFHHHSHAASHEHDRNSRSGRT